MKKFFVMAMMMMAAITASAQYEPGTFSIQPRLGFTASMMSNMEKLDIPIAGFGDVNLDTWPAVGLFVGADMEYQLSPLVSLSAGLNWAQTGSGWEDWKHKENGMTVEIKDTKAETSYLSIPLTANFYVWKGLALRTGVQMGFLTSAKLKMTVTASGTQNGLNVNQSTDFDESFKDECNKFDLSIPVGVSYEFNNHLVLDARYNIGVTKVNKDKEPGEKDSRNGVFSLTLGYKIKL